MNNNVKINNQIQADELRVIGDKGENLGVMSKDKALALAKEKGLDLIEVSSQAKPPVARIVDFDKYRYQEEKKLKKQKAGQKEQEVKQVQISIKSAQNDLLTKAKRVNKFMEKGHPVRLIMVLKGREKAHKDFAKDKLQQFLNEMVDPHKMIASPKFGGRGIITQIQKK